MDASNASRTIEQQITEVMEILNRAAKDSDFESARQRLARWKVRTGNLVKEIAGPEEAERFLEIWRHFSYTADDTMLPLTDEVNSYTSFVVALKEDFDSGRSPSFAGAAETADSGHLVVRGSRIVFLVHGHDELNMRRLEDLLRGWHLEPVILSFKPGRGRTLIEKFEEEARRAAFAFVLFTPDDLIQGRDAQYFQVRPNVLFELGWLYGRLGRQRVCIVSKRGTAIPSDLDGINRIEFQDSVTEKAGELQDELRAAGLLASQAEVVQQRESRLGS